MKEQIEKMLKRNLKRKLAITTATLIAFLLSANLAFAGGDYEVGNEGIKRENSGTLEETTENLKKTGLFKIEAETIENRLKDWSTIKLQNEVNKTFINKGKIYLMNEGIGKIENRGYIEFFLSINTASNILNSGYIDNMASDGNIYNKGYIEDLLSSDTLNKGISIENEGTIGTLNENKKLKNFGDVAVKNRAIASTEKIENYGLINFNGIGDYDTLKSVNKTANKGIVLESHNLKEISPNSTILKDDKGRLIKNYANSAIADTEINNGILNAFDATMDKNLEVKNNSVFNIYKAKIEDNKKISFNNSTLNMSYTLIENGIEMEFKNNSNIGNMKVIGQTSPLLKKLTIDNTTNVGSIMISDVDIEAINLVANEDIVNKNMVLRINDFETSPDKNVNTFVSTNVDLLGNSTTLGNITVKDGGRLTIGESTLFKNGLDDNVVPDDYYKKDIKIEGNGKILIGIDPYDISGIKELGQGNNLTDSIKGQVDTTDPNMLLAQDQLNIDADSLLHDIVIMPKYSFNYVDGAHEVRNKYKIVVAKDLAIPLPDDKPLQVTPAITITPGTSVTPSTPTVPATPAKPKDYGELNAIYRSIVTADKIKEFKVYNNDELKGFYRYLRDIYVNSPYTTTIGSSLDNLSMLREKALFEIKPNLNKWAVVGGAVYNDNETKYKASTTEVDTKTTGAYAKGEYGLKEDTTLGLILGGTNSKTDLSTGKIKGSSAYLGAYAKKYVNNFKFTLGTAVDFAEDKVKRDAIGYEGIIETSRSSAKQKSRAFDLYTELAYSKNLGNNFYIEPKFGLSYSRVRRGAVTENDGTVNLHVNSKTFNETKARVGLDLKKVIVSGNTIHNFIINTAYERILNGAKATTIKANVVGGSEFDILVPEREKGRATTGIEYKLENKFGLLFNLKVDYGFRHGSNKKSTRFSTGLGYKF